MEALMFISSISSFHEGFAVVEKNNKKGLISAEGELVIPCEYDSIHYWSSNVAGIESFWWQGYCLVEFGDKIGFVNMDGNVTCEVNNSKDAIQYGCALLMQGDDGAIYIIAADGTRTSIKYQDVALGGNGMLLIASDNNGFYLIDWYGHELIKAENLDDFDITHDYGYILVENERLYKIVRQ